MRTYYCIKVLDNGYGWYECLIECVLPAGLMDSYKNLDKLVNVLSGMSLGGVVEAKSGPAFVKAERSSGGASTSQRQCLEVRLISFLVPAAWQCNAKHLQNHIFTGGDLVAHRKFRSLMCECAWGTWPVSILHAWDAGRGA